MKKSNDVISVLMPAHNAEDSIEIAVKSTLNALPANAELLVFLDACTDLTETRLSQIKDTRIKIYRSSKNIGVAAALNNLLLISNGDIIARMDADDVCLPWRFKSQISKMKKTKADFVFTNAIVFGKKVFPLGILPQPPFGIAQENAGMSLIFSNPFVHPTMMSTKESLLSLGGYRNSASEDYDLWIRAVLMGKKLVRSCGYGLAYRMHANQLTQQISWQERNKSDVFVAESHRALVAKMYDLEIEAMPALGDLRQLTWNSARIFDLKTRFEIIKMIGIKKFCKYGVRGE